MGCRKVRRPLPNFNVLPRDGTRVADRCRFFHTNTFYRSSGPRDNKPLAAGCAGRRQGSQRQRTVPMRAGPRPRVVTTGLNAGVMLMNLTQMRDFGLEAVLVGLVDEYLNDLWYVDQDLFNIVFHVHPEKVLRGPCPWNFMHIICLSKITCKGQTPALVHGTFQTFSHPTKVKAMRAIGFAMQQTPAKKDSFLLHDSGEGDSERILTFATEPSLSCLAQERQLRGSRSRTFKVTTAQFYQLYKVHATVNGLVVPMVYVLMPKNLKLPTEGFLDVVLSHMWANTLEVEYSDSETAAINAIQAIIPGAKKQEVSQRNTYYTEVGVRFHRYPMACALKKDWLSNSRSAKEHLIHAMVCSIHLTAEDFKQTVRDNRAWILGLFVCKGVSYLQGVSVCASVNTLVAISIDRFFAICHPMKRQITIRVCRVIIAVIWSFSLTITLPWTFFFRLMPMLSESNSSLQVCREDWPTERMGMLYFIVANLILCYLLPLCVITLCYIFIWLKVWRRRPPGEAHDFGVENMIQRSKVKVAKMLLVVVIVFAISWLPLYAIFARLKIGEPLVDGSAEQAVIEVAAPVAQWLESYE
ncbi:hypothetical protein ISCGN_014867 [Ixodes scapularis]